MATNARAYVPPQTRNTDYPMIDSDPHFKRVVSYARPIDYAKAVGMTAMPPAMMVIWERVAPSHVGKGGFASVMRLTGAIGLTAGFLMFYQSSALRFYGVKENDRERERDMREMVAKVKNKEALWGESTLSPYMQGVASRNSRYSAVFFHIIPWFNVVNHPHHGIDTAKYYQQAERELEAERLGAKS